MCTIVIVSVVGIYIMNMPKILVLTISLLTAQFVVANACDTYSESDCPTDRCTWDNSEGYCYNTTGLSKT